MTPQSHADFPRALRIELTAAQAAARQFDDNGHANGYATGYLDALKWVHEYFFGPWEDKP